MLDRLGMYEFLDLPFKAVQIIITIILLLFHRRKKENEYGRSRHATLKTLTQPFCRLKNIINLQKKIARHLVHPTVVMPVRK